MNDPELEKAKHDAAVAEAHAREREAAERAEKAERARTGRDGGDNDRGDTGGKDE